jgi:hypothetical protein
MHTPRRQLDLARSPDATAAFSNTTNTFDDLKVASRDDPEEEAGRPRDERGSVLNKEAAPQSACWRMARAGRVGAAADLARFAAGQGAAVGAVESEGEQTV